MAGIKGKSGGARVRSGRKRKDEEDRLLRLLDKAVGDDDFVTIFRVMAARAKAGDVQAAKELTDRRFGKVTDRHEVSGKDGEPIPLAVQFIPYGRADTDST